MTELESLRRDIGTLEKRVDALHDALKLVIAALEEKQARKKLDFSSIPGHRQHSQADLDAGRF